jgi:hypothetical protein
MRMFISTFAFHVIITFAMNAIFHLNDDLILDRKRRNKNDDCHNHDKFNENKMINANF